jgi:hypothetical protein
MLSLLHILSDIFPYVHHIYLQLLFVLVDLVE